MSAYRVGLTGGIASGKSTAALFLAACGAAVQDADAVVEALTAPGGAALEALRREVGGWVLTPQGEYDRAAVRARIFSEAALRQKIEGVLHPLARQEMRVRLEAAGAAYAVGVIPLLFESGGWDGYFDAVVAVDCPREAQLARARARDGRDDAAHIIAAQLDAGERRRRADIVLENSGGYLALFAAAYRLHRRLRAAAQEKAAAC